MIADLRRRVASALPVTVKWRLRRIHRALARWRSPGSLPRPSFPPWVGPGDQFALHVSERPIARTTIVYESFHGGLAACGPRALFDAFRTDPRTRGWKHVWILDDPSVVPDDWRSDPSISIVSREETRYPYVLATAAILVNNTTFPSWYSRRDGQVYVNTWHGVPLKRMFRDEPGPIARYANSQRNFLQASHIFLQGDYTTDRILGTAEVRPLCVGKTWHVGTARLDRTIRARTQRQPNSQRRVLFAPTWRGVPGKAADQHDDVARVVRLVSETATEPTTLLVKAHNFTSVSVAAVPVGSGLVTVEPVDPRSDVNDVLASVDVLVSDYSSILVDALAADIPTVLFVPDLDEYAASRGLYTDLSSLPATVCRTDDDLIAALRDTAPPTAFGQAYENARSTYFPDEDGTACRRILDVVLGSSGAAEPIGRLERPVLAFWAGAWRANGITTSAVNLLRQIDPERYHVVLLTSGTGLPESAAELLARLPRHLTVLHRVGDQPATPPERAALREIEKTDRISSTTNRELLDRTMRREGRRLLGDTPVDACVQFSGYERFWTMLMAAVPARRRVIYQHNDMWSEFVEKHPVLQSVFTYYPDYDVIAAVSEETKALNLAALGKRYGSARPAAVRNSLDIDRLRQANENPELTLTVDGVLNDVLDDQDPGEPGVRSVKVMPTWEPGVTHFVTLGRCSPEKNHAMLLHAFARLVRSRPEARLTILGDGPLLGVTRSLRDALGLRDVVRVPGYAGRGLELLRAADCMVLPSLYEGQPMTILEALALGRPVIATDIAGSRSALSGHGVLVPSTDPEPFAEAMEDFCAGRMPTFEPFDAEAYNRAALDEFYRLLGDPL